MAIRYPGGTTVLGTINCSSYSQIIEDLRTNLVNAGWSDQLIKAYVVFTFNGLPSNNQTCAVAGRTYRFVNTLSAANDVKIGATAAACASNLYDAINDNEANEGITYGSGTTIHPDVEAILTSANVVRVRWKASGTGNGFSASTLLSNVTLDSTSGRFGGYYLDSQCTPAGLEVRVYPYWDSADSGVVRIGVMPADGSTVNQTLFPYISVAGHTLHVLANRYQYVTYLPNSTLTLGVAHQCIVPYIRDLHHSPIVSSVEDSGGRYRLTLDRPHGLVTDQYVSISGARGVSNLNGYWQVEVINSTTIELIGSAYTVGYEANSARSAGPGQISRAFIYLMSGGGGNLRVNLASDGEGNARKVYCLNQHYYTGNFVNDRFVMPYAMGSATRLRNWGEFFDLFEPRIAWPITGAGSEMMIVGELWEAFIVNAPAPADVVKQGFDGRNFMNYTHNSSHGSLWFALPQN